MKPSQRNVAIVVFVLIVLVASVILLQKSGANGPTAPTVAIPTATGPATLNTGHREALGSNNPMQGDCTTNTSEAATSVGFVVLSLTPRTFQAEIQVQKGSPNTAYGVFMQQVPGSCPQEAANAGTLTTDATGRGHALATVPRVPSATTFYVQLVPGEAGPPDYTSDRITVS